MKTAKLLLVVVLGMASLSATAQSAPELVGKWAFVRMSSPAGELDVSSEAALFANFVTLQKASGQPVDSTQLKLAATSQYATYQQAYYLFQANGSYEANLPAQGGALEKRNSTYTFDAANRTLTVQRPGKEANVYQVKWVDANKAQLQLHLPSKNATLILRRAS